MTTTPQLDGLGWAVTLFTIIATVVTAIVFHHRAPPIESAELKPTPAAVEHSCLGLYSLPACHAVPELFGTSLLLVVVLTLGIVAAKKSCRNRWLGKEQE